VFGSKNMDLNKISREVQKIRDQKKYLQSSHIQLSMRKYEDHFKSMNSEIREAALATTATIEHENPRLAAKEVTKKMKSSNINMD